MKKLLLILGSIFTMLNILVFAFMIHSSITNILPYEIMEEEKITAVSENERLKEHIEYLESEEYIERLKKYERFYNNVLSGTFNFAGDIGYSWNSINMTYEYRIQGRGNIDIMHILNIVQHENYKLMEKE